MPDLFVTWCLIVGLLLVAVGLTDTVRQQLPFSTSALYLVAGYLLGPEVFGLLTLRLVDDAVLLERLTEAAVVISLFAVGLRLRAGFGSGLWHAPFRLATLTMVVTITLLTGVGLVLGLSLGVAVLLAAVLAPTDPVLASDVQLEHALDRDRVRFALTGEGGLNDGAAFPFVMLGLGLLGVHELGPFGARWWAVDVFWATAAGIGIGWALGLLFSRAVLYLRRERGQAFGMESFLTLGLIALSYGLALWLHAYGFLAVFAAGLAMRQVERTQNPAAVEPGRKQAAEPPADAARPADAAQVSSHMTKAVLDFTLDLEKLAELGVMVIIGSLVTVDAFTPAALLVAAALIFVVRPLAIYLTTWRIRLTATQRRLVAWFGIRGIGSIYYLSYAVAHGVDTGLTPLLADAVLVTIVLSVLLHGSTATPVMRLYQRSRS
ncbi:MAG: cation:proton antiporter [Rhizobiales bacterium]|nr:cation:proton antiporter [Rhizobacter sp.]